MLCLTSSVLGRLSVTFSGAFDAASDGAFVWAAPAIALAGRQMVGDGVDGLLKDVSRIWICVCQKSAGVVNAAARSARQDPKHVKAAGRLTIFH